MGILYFDSHEPLKQVLEREQPIKIWAPNASKPSKKKDNSKKSDSSFV